MKGSVILFRKAITDVVRQTTTNPYVYENRIGEIIKHQMEFIQLEEDKFKSGKMIEQTIKKKRRRHDDSSDDDSSDDEHVTLKSKTD